MLEYKIVIPIGNELPSVGNVITVAGDFKGANTQIRVSAITSITWGVAKSKENPTKEGVAGVYVELQGVPWPPIALTVNQEAQRAKQRHFVVCDPITLEPKTCFNGDDLTREVTRKRCPVCSENHDSASKLADALRKSSIQLKPAGGELPAVITSIDEGNDTDKNIVTLMTVGENMQNLAQAMKKCESVVHRRMTDDITMGRAGAILQTIASELKEHNVHIKDCDSWDEVLERLHKAKERRRHND